MGEDTKTLGAALLYLTERTGVTLDDPDDLLGHMTAGVEGSESLYEYLEGLHHARTAKREHTTDGVGDESTLDSAGNSDNRKGRR